MIVWVLYVLVAVLLVLVELAYFRIADKCNIIDEPNQRSSHSKIVLRGGGVIFTLAMIVWAALAALRGGDVVGYLPFLGGLLLVAGVSFWDDVHSLPDSVRLMAQVVAMTLVFWSLGLLEWRLWWVVLVGLFMFVGAANVFNFMDGINGITAGYSLAVLVPLLLINNVGDEPFVMNSFLIVAILGMLVFAYFNFRPQGRVKCFAGDVGAVGIAFILLFALGRLMVQTRDITYLVFMVVYGVDGCCTIIHRILEHDHLGEAHRKHAYQLLSNELGRGHLMVASLYANAQLIISLVMIYVVPNTLLAHWLYFGGVTLALCAAYVWFIKKFYHLHREYLGTLEDPDNGTA